MKITDNYAVTTRTMAELDPDEQFDFQRRYSTARTYRARRVFVEWSWSAGSWTPRRVEWSGPQILKSGELSDASAGTDAHTFSAYGSSGVRDEVAAAMREMRFSLPTVARRAVETAP